MLLVVILLVGDIPLFRTFNEKYVVLKTIELVVIGYLALLNKTTSSKLCSVEHWCILYCVL